MSLQVPIPTHWTDGLSKGVNFSIAGTGGPECVAFIPNGQKIAETCFSLLISFSFIGFSWKHLKLNTKAHFYAVKETPVFQQFLLLTLCLTFGVEIGYKLSTSSVIFLANPCHILTFVEILILAAPPRKWVTAVFRVTIHSMHGAVVAILLPVTNTRSLPFEVVVYWVQHFLIVLIPFYLISRGGPFKVEPLKDMSWPVFTLGILYFIYWIPVQGLCILTEVNLNNMVCPAVSDPFYGRGYRLWALGHCGICILLWGKLYTFVSLMITGQTDKVDEPQTNGCNGHIGTSENTKLE